MKNIASIVPYLKKETGGFGRKFGVYTIASILMTAAFIGLIIMSVVKNERLDSAIEAKRMEIDPVDLEEFEQELDELEEIQPTETETFTDTPAPPIEDAPDVADNQEEAVEDLSSLNIQPTDSPLIMSGLFAGRSANGRSRNLKRYGGKHGEATEKAVLRALEWLRKNQKPDGSWKSDRPVGITGLGLLTFLAHGETPSSEKYGVTVEKAMKYLVDKQDDKGYFDTSGHMYTHGIATYAISEAYALTQIPSLKPALESGIAVIVEGMNIKKVAKKGSLRPVVGVDTPSGKISAGSWNYKYSGDRWDLSFAGWQVQALKAAKLAGSKNEKLKQTLDIATNGVKHWQNENTGKFGYASVGSGSRAMTSVGTLCLQLLGHGKSPEVQKGMTVLEPATCDFEKAGGRAFYDWYYLTQAKFHSGGDVFKQWNNRFAPAYVEAQEADGHWTSAQGKVTHGKAYSTTLAALTLMVYYRNLPTFQEKAVSETPAEVIEEDDDIKIDLI
jgi:hypothetical protein